MADEFTFDIRYGPQRFESGEDTIWRSNMGGGLNMRIKKIKFNNVRFRVTNSSTYYDTITIYIPTYDGSLGYITSFSTSGGVNRTLDFEVVNLNIYQDVNTDMNLVVRTSHGITVQTDATSSITITAEIAYYKVNCVASEGGTVSANATSVYAGNMVKLTPTAKPGYRFNNYTIVTNNKTSTTTDNTFYMPHYDVTVTANFVKTAFTVTKAVSPSGAGTVTVDKESANSGETVTLSQTPAAGYYFTGWVTQPAVTINSSGKFTMPASNVTVTAKYARRSTAYVDKTSIPGGSTLKLTINAESTTYSHKYQLSFGSGMETSVTNVAAGVSKVDISVPLNWCQSIPNAIQKTGGTLTVWTYIGGTQIGYYTITGLTYTVPGTVVPTLTDIVTSIVRTIGGKTYANVGEYYIQKHSAVRIRTTAAGVQGSSITSIAMTMSGYSGTNYNKTQSGSSLDFTSALLTNRGECTITAVATDSRGRTVTKTAKITVKAYDNPSGTLNVWRVDSGGTADELGNYAQYSLTKAYTQIGNNSLQEVTLKCSGQSASNPANSGNVLPGNRLVLSVMQEFEVTMTIRDKFETTIIKKKIQSGKFIMHVDSGGDRMGIMKAANKSIPSGKSGTFEIAATCQMYIGDYTLEDYIRLIANS